MSNPLLDWKAQTPPWSKITPQQLEPAVDAVLRDNRQLIARLTARGQPSWDTLIAPLEEADNRLHKAFSPGSHLHGVLDSPQWRAAYEACLPKLTEYGSEVGQNPALFAAYEQVARNSDLDPAQTQLLANALRDFRLSGVNLPETAKQRLREIQQRLAELGNRFQQNVLDATDGWCMVLADPADLAGIPEAAVERARRRAQARDQDGYLFGLDFPSYDAVLTYAQNRELRARVYAAYCTRASDQGPDAGRWDNGPLIEEILQLRAEEAQLLGFTSYAQLSLATKMADSPQAVENFLLELASKARPRALEELAELTEFAQAQGGPTTLEPWDLAYYSEQLKAQRYDFSDELLKPYFALPQVLKGLFAISGRLFGIQVQEAPDLSVWHADVRAFRVQDAGGELLAYFFLDPYAREKKRGGAWMDDCAGRVVGSEGAQIPVAILCCNFTPATATAPALLTHDEVTTLFHEFGHGLHHMLTRVNYLGVSGINGVAWDAVELPSQFMENWCWERESLDLFAQHFETGAAIPGVWLDRLRQSRNFNAGIQTIRQVELALFDLRVHGPKTAEGPAVNDILRAIRAGISVIQPPAWNRFASGFSHIFGGGYAAGYYSYKWAEVLAADAFSAFEESGIFDADTGRHFRQSILERGGSADAMELFREFRGREPQVDPLLRQSGLI